MTASTTTQTAPAAEVVRLPGRTLKTSRTGHKYVSVQRVLGAAVTVLSFTERFDNSTTPPTIKGWSKATYSVTTLETPEGQPPALKTFAEHIVWTGSQWKVGDQRAKGMTSAVKIVMGTSTSADVVTSRRRTTTARRTTTSTTTSRRAAAQAAPSAEGTPAGLSDVLQRSIERQAAQNRRPSEGGGGEVARRPARPKTAKQQAAALKREQAATRKAQRDAATAAATENIDAALAANTAQGSSTES